MLNTAAGSIRVYVLGDARIETPVAVIEPSAELAFAAALYLLLEQQATISRRSLERLLWPSVSPTMASHRMRQTLLKLRRLGVPVETAGKSTLRVNRSGVVVDVDVVLGSARHTEGLPKTKFMVLPDYEPKVSSAFAEWLDAKRGYLEARVATSLLPIVSRHRLRANWEEVEAWAAALLRLAPFNEEATLALAEAHAMRGAKLEGVRILDRYLSEIGDSNADLRLPATVMRRRIADRMPPRPSQSAPDTPIIGRGDIISALSEMLPAVRTGSGRACLLYGDAGIGKSRVFAELTNFAALQGFTCVRVQCRFNDPFRPLAVFVDLVPLLRGMRGAIGCSPETMKQLDRLTTHTQMPSSSITRQGDADFAYAKIQLAVADLIDAVADESPLLILVEDIQRLDEASAALLADLIAWTSRKPILLAFTARDAKARWLESAGQLLQVIRLNPLDLQSSRQIIMSNVAQFGRAMSDDYLAWCVRVAEGNPYFLTELASHWAQTGERQEAPPSLNAVIEQRLAMLEGPALHLLQTCTLLEKNSTLERIEKTLDYPQHQLLESLDQLSSLGMIVLESNDSGFETNARLSPKHELLANAAEHSLTPPVKAFLHRRIGVVLESEKDDNHSSAILWDCAKHWRLAGDLDKAFFVARSCAKHLMDLGLCAEAADAYEKTLAFCTSDTQRLQIWQSKAQAYFRACDWQHLSIAASKAREIQRRVQGEEPVHDDVELMDIRATWQRGGQVDTLASTLRCLSYQGASIDHRCRAGIMALMLMDHACDLEGMRKTYDMLRPLLMDERADRSHAFEAGMVFETVCGDLGAVLPLAQALLGARRTSESIADLMRALTNCATAARTAGHFAEATTWLNEAIHIAECHKLPLATEAPMQILASMALDRNDIPDATHWYNKLLALPKSSYDTASRTIKDSIGLRISLTNGDIGVAKRLVQSEMKELAADPLAYRRTYGLALLISVTLASGEIPDDAMTQLLESSHLIARRSARQGFATCVLVSALRRRGAFKRADQLLKEYLEVYRREPSPAPLHVLKLLDATRLKSARDQRGNGRLLPL